MQLVTSSLWNFSHHIYVCSTCFRMAMYCFWCGLLRSNDSTLLYCTDQQWPFFPRRWCDVVSYFLLLDYLHAVEGTDQLYHARIGRDIYYWWPNQQMYDWYFYGYNLPTPSNQTILSVVFVLRSTPSRSTDFIVQGCGDDGWQSW